MVELPRARGTIAAMDPTEQRAKQSFERARALARRTRELWPLTWLGAAVAAVSAIALFRFGFGKLDLVLLVLGYGGAGLLLIATFLVLSAAIALWWRLRRAPQSWRGTTFETGAAVGTGFSLPSLWWLPLVQLRWVWEAPRADVEPPHRVRGRLEERVTLRERGIFSSVTRRVRIQDAFGLARVELRHAQEGTIEVLPHLGGIRRLPVLSSLTGGEEMPHPLGLEDGDRVELRRYVPGDSARFIHWKVFGRTRRLMVRIPERALSRARRTVAYLVAGPDDEAAAAAARAAVEEDALGADWELAADGSPEPTSDASQALHKIMASSRYRGPSGSGLTRFLAEVDPHGPAALVVFAPATMGPWVDQLRAVTARRHGRVRVVVAVDAVHDAAPPSPWRQLLLKPGAVRGTPRAELERVARALGRLRCEVVVFDRVSGRVLGDGAQLRGAERRAA